MKSYNNFIGIDIGKFTFVVAIYGEKSVKEYENTALGITQFLGEFKKALTDGLCILEPTGGYEIRLLLALCENNYAAHRAHKRKNLRRSKGIKRIYNKKSRTSIIRLPTLNGRKINFTKRNASTNRKIIHKITARTITAIE